jgi:hypothetical protein
MNLTENDQNQKFIIDCLAVSAHLLDAFVNTKTKAISFLSKELTYQQALARFSLNPTACATVICSTLPHLSLRYDIQRTLKWLKLVDLSTSIPRSISKIILARGRDKDWLLKLSCIYKLLSPSLRADFNSIRLSYTATPLLSLETAKQILKSTDNPAFLMGLVTNYTQTNYNDQLGDVLSVAKDLFPHFHSFYLNNVRHRSFYDILFDYVRDHYTSQIPRIFETTTQLLDFVILKQRELSWVTYFIKDLKLSARITVFLVRTYSRQD